VSNVIVVANRCTVPCSRCAWLNQASSRHQAATKYQVTLSPNQPATLCRTAPPRYQSGDTYVTAQYVVPTKPGWSRLLQASAVNVRSPRFSSPLLARAAMALARLLPSWAHLHVRNAVLDEDLYRLHLLVSVAGSSWGRHMAP
jgi:hypothetical protein